MPVRTEEQETLQEIIRRIVRVADPDKIILFGSAARGEAHGSSDYDLLVVKSDVPHRGRLTEEIYMGLIGMGTPVDIIVVTPEDIERHRNAHATVIKPALREGMVIYERQPASSR